ncbi:MAG: ribosome small subunit-dependent GTPase A, partial [Candidatus Aenigmarchaeota archaeon]|nr:ribosome small subunit-dependent GTPase A [Candidatus Aenigmarchaeota archaeon]
MKQENIELETIGWDLFFKDNFSPYKIKGFIPGRITQVRRKTYIALTELGEINVKISGKFRFTHEKEAYPVVGDWVVIKDSNDIGVIQAVLPRKSKISRKVAGKTIEEQIIVSNVDIVWIVSGLDKEFNIQLIERYLTLVSESGAKPVIILNKSDLCDNINEKMEEVRKLSQEIPIHLLSAESNKLDILKQYLLKGKTIAIIGSSGVGKSTIINKLLGIERQKTGAVRESDNQGRHTTTYREMIVFPNGGIIIDNPGMDEIQLWFKGNDLADAFKDIEDISLLCKFKNCNHKSEPGCAIKDAIENKELDQRRYEHYLKLRKESHILSAKQSNMTRKHPDYKKS